MKLTNWFLKVDTHFISFLTGSFVHKITCVLSTYICFTKWQILTVYVVFARVQPEIVYILHFVFVLLYSSLLVLVPKVADTGDPTSQVHGRQHRANLEVRLSRPLMTSVGKEFAVEGEGEQPWHRQLGPYLVLLLGWKNSVLKLDSLWANLELGFHSYLVFLSNVPNACWLDLAAANFVRGRASC